MIKIVFKKPSQNPIIMEIEYTLEKLQELVEGYIEIIPISRKIFLIVNEEGRLMNLKPNIWIENTCIVGNIIFVQNKNDGEFHSLTDNMINEIINRL